MTHVRIPAPDLEADVSAEQVVAYLLGSGWVEVDVSPPRPLRRLKRLAPPAYVIEVATHDQIGAGTWLALAISDIARAEGRHPSAVLADVEGEVRGSAGAACQPGPDLDRSKCKLRMTVARKARERAEWEASRVYVETADERDGDAEEPRGGEGSEG